MSKVGPYPDKLILDLVTYHFISGLIGLRLFSYVLNLKIYVVFKASCAIVIRRFSLNEAHLGMHKFISDYLPYFEKNKYTGIVQYNKKSLN